MIGIELVKDRVTKERAVAERDKVVDACFRRGLLVLGAGKNAIRISPPLVLTKAQAATAVEILDAGLRGRAVCTWPPRCMAERIRFGRRYAWANRRSALIRSARPSMLPVTNLPAAIPRFPATRSRQSRLPAELAPFGSNGVRPRRVARDCRRRPT